MLNKIKLIDEFYIQVILLLYKYFLLVLTLLVLKYYLFYNDRTCKKDTLEAYNTSTWRQRHEDYYYLEMSLAYIPRCHLKNK